VHSLSQLVLLLVKPRCDVGQLGIQTFQFLVLPLLLLSQYVKVKLDISCIISLELAHINLVLELHYTVFICMLEFKEL